MHSAWRVQIPEGREAETHREDVILEKVAAEPNRFEIKKITNRKNNLWRPQVGGLATLELWKIIAVCKA